MPAPAPQPVSASSTREVVLRLHAARKPWLLVPEALAWLTVHPDDTHVRGTLTASLLHLGLSTPAREQAMRLAAEVGAPLRQAATTLPADTLPLDTRVATLRANLAALAAGHAARTSEPPPFDADLHAALIDAVAATGATQWLRATDGTVVIRPAEGDTDRPFTHWHDDAGWARAQPIASGHGAVVVYVHTLRVPALLARLAAALTASPDGFHPRIVLVEPDPTRLAHALAAADLSTLLAQPRFEWIIGPDASGRLEASLAARRSCAIAGPSVSGTPGVSAVATAQAVARAVSAQEHEAARIAASMRSAGTGRTPAWWSARYSEALAPGSRAPLRVLFSTTRFSTFVQHSTRDLAAAFESAGCRTRTIIEPDCASRATNVAAGRAVVEFDPDLILCINYHRGNLGGMAPAEVPYVCWVQDAMPHLFTREAAAGLGEADFVVGHLHDEFFTRFGYPVERALALPVLVSGAKFHAAPVADGAAGRFDCEVAAMTNQSDTGPQLRDRVLAANAGNPAVAAIVADLYTRVESIVEASASQPCMDRLRSAAEECLRARAGAAEPATLANLINQVALPLADRLLRHRALTWAADACARRGWRFHLYGQNWHAHPTLARFARGPVAHGEDLRAAYQRAACCLHASVNWNLHQRVLECALSGGFPITLRKHDDLVLLEWLASRSISLHTDGWLSDPRSRATRGLAADHAHAMMHTAQLQRLGQPCDGSIRWDRAHWLAHGTHGWGGALHPDTIWLMGDLCETSFATPAEVEHVLTTAVERPQRRASLAAGIRRRVGAHLTYEQAARQILGFVARGLEHAAAPAPAA